MPVYFSQYYPLSSSKNYSTWRQLTLVAQMKKRESILTVFLSHLHLIFPGIYSMGTIFKINLNLMQQRLTISIAISIVEPCSVCLELNYWNSHRIGLRVSTWDPPCKAYFYMRAGMILWKHCQNKSAFNGSLFHSKEQLKSLQWLTKLHNLSPSLHSLLLILRLPLPKTASTPGNCPPCFLQLARPSPLRLHSSCSLCMKNLSDFQGSLLHFP